MVHLSQDIHMLGGGGRVSLCTFLQQTLADFDDKDLFVLL